MPLYTKSPPHGMDGMEYDPQVLSISHPCWIVISKLVKGSPVVPLSIIPVHSPTIESTDGSGVAVGAGNAVG